MGMITSEKGYIGTIEGRCIVTSGGIGNWRPEDVQELTDVLLKLAKPFAGKKWAYIADPTRMDKILSKETSAAFVKLHMDLEAAGCRAIAFLDGNTAAMKIQSQKHQNSSDTKMEVLHFKNQEQALDWLKDMGI